MTAPRLISATDAARHLGYTKPTAAFYARLTALGIRAVWRGRYDLVKLNEAIDREINPAQPESRKNEYAGISYG